MPSARPAVRAYQRGPHLKRRGRVWYAYGGPFGRGGQSLHTEDHAEAETRFRAELARSGERRDAVSGGTAAREETLATCLTTWTGAPHGYTRRTKESHEERVTSVVAWLTRAGATLPSEVTDELVDRWVTARSAKVARRTINRDLRSLRVCLRWCAGRGMCAMPRALERKGLREPTPEGHAMLPDPDEVRRVIEAIPSQGYRDALVIYYATGLRYEELYRLAVGDAHDGRLWVQPQSGPADTAEPSKGYRARSVPLAPEVMRVVVRFLAWRDPSKRALGAHKNALHRAIRAACEATKVPRFGLHDLRRCFATEAVRRGVKLTVVRDWLGHRLTGTTERYVGRYRSDADVVAPVPAMLAGGADSLLNPGAEISTKERQLSTKAPRKARG